jgi:hypothetical protein
LVFGKSIKRKKYEYAWHSSSNNTQDINNTI